MRKGVSPIIAAVILIVITVALGFLIFSSSNKIIEDLSPAPDCSQVSFQAALFPRSGSYFLDATNTGNAVIEGFNLNIKDDFDQVEIQKYDLLLNPSESGSVLTQLQAIDNLAITVIPIIKNKEGTPSVCEMGHGMMLSPRITGYVIN